MDSSTVYYFSSVTRIITTGTKNPIVIALSPAFSTNLATLAADKSRADELMLILEGKTLGNTAENLILKKDTSTIFSIVCSLVSGYGASIKDGDLIGMGSYSYSTLFKTKPEELVKSLDAILKVVNTNKTALLAHGISPALILKITGFKDDYSEHKFTTKDAIDLHKNTKTQLELLMVKMKKDTTTQLDKNAEFFRLDNMEYYLTYKSARKVAHRHTHNKTPISPDATTGNLELIITNKTTGEDIQNVEFSILSINYIAMSDVNGEILKELLVPGEYTGTLSCPGFAKIDFTFTIKKGETTDLGFMMEMEAI
ncbi:MAG: hypothetical protein WCL51_15840 [Bacteroidota bacterium]